MRITTAALSVHWSPPSALVATKRDDAPIPYNQGGPIRLVYPDGSKLSSVLDAWNWSLVSINVTGLNSGS